MEDRLLKLLDAEQLSSSKFADVIGVQRSSISHILSGRNKPSFDFLQKILRAFPMLNADWLILGEGNMYEGETGPVGGGGSLFDQPPVHFPGEVPESIDKDVEKPSLAENGSNMNSDVDTGTKETIQEHEIPVDSPGHSSSSFETATRNAKKKVSRVIVLYDDNTFHSYEQG